METEKSAEELCEQKKSDSKLLPGKLKVEIN